MTDIKRRDVLRYSAAGTAIAASALVGAQALAAPEPAAGAPEATAGQQKIDPRDFDEIYKGKRIRGRYLLGGKNELLINGKALALTAIPTLFVPEDGRKPYVGIGLISAVNHYDPVEIELSIDGLKKLVRKIVDILGDLELSDEAAQAHVH
ncbi:hypothetical protein GCM10025331_84200 [Actinoplanes utahensis]|uniref:Tyrosinase n=2 Tax=Actinoplanes utahensis TaxID=1869 RepID=A0A0A6UM32_ACTUT|nr:hypothetical protein MB27_23220 [Actinoplanes utahensis]GIF33747.1 hypothetical protein Aut01nite_67330 [Actinoplanes utahensis]